MSIQDRLFGIHDDALSLQRQRLELLSSNLANADTPGFLARDIDFGEVLREQLGDVSGPRLHTTDVRHIAVGPGTPAAPEEKWRMPVQPSRDGNSVDAQIEQAAFTDAAMHYQASLSFLDGRLKSLMTAITGQ